MQVLETVTIRLRRVVGRVQRVESHEGFSSEDSTNPKWIPTSRNAFADILRGPFSYKYLQASGFWLFFLYHHRLSMQDVAVSQPTQQSFNPYTENGGTILAIAGADFSVIAGDTRQSEGYSIQTRYAPKVFRL